MNEKFEKWLLSVAGVTPVNKEILWFSENDMLDAYKAGVNSRDKELSDLQEHANDLAKRHIDVINVAAEKTQELEALRGFANRVIKYGAGYVSVAREFGLCDETGQPTALLTG